MSINQRNSNNALIKPGLWVLIFILAFAGCAPAATAVPTSAAPATLNVMVHDSFAASEPVIAQFEKQYNVKLNFIKSGDAGSLVNKAILSKNAPLADVIYGVDNTFLSRALDGGIYEAYASPLLKNIPSQFLLDPTNQALPVDYGDVCVNYDKAYFASRNLAVPATLEDLVKPEYKGMLVMENPAVSSPGLAFLMGTIVHFGEQGFQNYWKSLQANGLVVVNDWETAYYTNFSGSSGKGSQPLVVSYATSPVAEVVFAKTPPTDAPTASIVGPDSCFRQIEFVGILKGTTQRAMAEKFVDFMLGDAFQEDMPLQMFVDPVNPDAKLPDSFTKYAQVPQQPAQIAPAEIAKNRDTWIQQWKDIVLK
ncbi:MAG TPA: thiamine ABC transporter substrate-binding protein [Anaerolineaceae bacterium]|nr:thiamine ABC transporter substrate-binding protein [Anaerolineaceae bacterium]